MADSHSFFEQIRRNSVALISLSVAVSGLTYNTWRTDLSEENRNTRFAAFEILLRVGELQELVFVSHYDNDAIKGNPRSGWAYVLTIRDLAEVLPAPMPAESKVLLASWETNWEGLGKEQVRADAISAAIEEMRSHTRTLLLSLK